MIRLINLKGRVITFCLFSSEIIKLLQRPPQQKNVKLGFIFNHTAGLNDGFFCEDNPTPENSTKDIKKKQRTWEERYWSKVLSNLLQLTIQTSSSYNCTTFFYFSVLWKRVYNGQHPSWGCVPLKLYLRKKVASMSKKEWKLSQKSFTKLWRRSGVNQGKRVLLSIKQNKITSYHLVSLFYYFFEKSYTIFTHMVQKNYNIFNWNHIFPSLFPFYFYF
jgi:hypothetical protein